MYLCMLIVFNLGTLKRVITVSCQPTEAEIMHFTVKKREANNPTRALAFKQNQN